MSTKRQKVERRHNYFQGPSDQKENCSYQNNKVKYQNTKNTELHKNGRSHKVDAHDVDWSADSVPNENWRSGAGSSLQVSSIGSWQGQKHETIEKHGEFEKIPKKRDTDTKPGFTKHGWPIKSESCFKTETPVLSKIRIVQNQTLTSSIPKNLNNWTDLNTWISQNIEEWARTKRRCTNCLKDGRITGSGPGLRHPACGARVCTYCWKCGTHAKVQSRNVEAACFKCSDYVGKKRPNNMTKIRGFKNDPYYKPLYENFTKLYYEQFLCTNCYSEGHSVKTCNYCWKCKEHWDREAQLDMLDARTHCPKCGQSEGKLKPSSAKYQPYQMERAKDFDIISRNGGIVPESLNQGRLLEDSGKDKAESKSLQNSSALDPWKSVPESTFPGSKGKINFQGKITPKIKEILKQNTKSRDKLIKEQQHGRCGNCMGFQDAHPPFDMKKPEENWKNCNYCFTCHKHFKMSGGKCGKCAQPIGVKRPANYWRNQCRQFKDLDLINLLESGFFCKNCLGPHVEDKCDYCFKCDVEIPFQKQGHFYKQGCRECGQEVCTERPDDWDLGVTKTGDRKRLEILVGWLKKLGYEVIDESDEDVLIISETSPLADIDPDFINEQAAFLSTDTSKQSLPIPKKKETRTKAQKTGKTVQDLPIHFKQLPNICQRRMPDPNFVNKSELPTSGLCVKVAENPEVVNKIGSKIREVYIKDNSVKKIKNVSMFLDVFIMYRDKRQTLSFKMASSIAIMTESEKFAETVKNRKWSHPGRQIIIGLPVELNPDAVENCLGYVHGDSIDLPVPELKSSLEKLFIIANYLQVYPLVHQVRLFATQRRIVMDFDGMSRFIQTLPEIVFMDDFPINIRQLPSQNAVTLLEDGQGRNSTTSPNIQRIEPLHSNMIGSGGFNGISNEIQYENASERYRKRPHEVESQHSNNFDNKYTRTDNSFGGGGGLINDHPPQIFIPPEQNFEEPSRIVTGSTPYNANSSNSFNFPNPYNR